MVTAIRPARLFCSKPDHFGLERFSSFRRTPLKTTPITFAQYLYEDGSIAHELAHAFAERCRKGVKVDILPDRHGSGKILVEIVGTMKEAGCHVEYFRQIKAEGVVFPWRLLRYNYRIVDECW